MGRMYTAAFSAQAQTAQVDFFELLAATGKPVRVHAIHLSQVSEVGDAAEEGLAVIIKRGVGVTSGSGGATPTPAPIDVNDAAAGATVESCNTTKATGGTFTTLEAHNWNIRQPFVRIYAPEERPRVHPGDRLVVELGTTEADSITFSGTLVFEET